MCAVDISHDIRFGGSAIIGLCFLLRILADTLFGEDYIMLEEKSYTLLDADLNPPCALLLVTFALSQKVALELEQFLNDEGVVGGEANG